MQVGQACLDHRLFFSGSTRWILFLETHTPIFLPWNSRLVIIIKELANFVKKSLPKGSCNQILFFPHPFWYSIPTSTYSTVHLLFLKTTRLSQLRGLCLNCVLSWYLFFVHPPPPHQDCRLFWAHQSLNKLFHHLQDKSRKRSKDFLNQAYFTPCRLKAHMHMIL